MFVEGHAGSRDRDDEIVGDYSESEDWAALDDSDAEPELLTRRRAAPPRAA